MNGDAPASIASISGGAKPDIPPKTTAKKTAMRDELKVKSTMLLAISDEHLFKFHGIKDAKTLWEAIKTRFGGNKESKKMQTILKKQYENFVASRSEVNIAHNVSAASSQGQASASTYANDVMFSFFATQSNSLQLDNEDLEQIDTDDLEEMDLKWSQGNRNRDNTRKVVPVETPANALVVTNRMGYDWSYQAEEGPTDFALMAFSSSDKTSLGYDSQFNERDLTNKSDVFKSASDSSVNESEEVNNQANDRYKAGEWYHVVPLPYTGNFMPLRPDLSFAGLYDSVFKSTISETITNVHKTKTSTSKNSKESMEKPKTVRPSALIIKDYESDSDDDCELRPSIKQNKPSHAEINFVKSDENTRKSVIEPHTYKQAENLGKVKILGLIKRLEWNDDSETRRKSMLNRGNFVLTTVITNSGKVPVNAAKQISPKAAASTSTARYVNTDANRPTVNVTKPSSNVFHKSHSPVRRTFNQRTTPKNNVTTAGTKAIVSAVQGNRENDQGIFDSGCSRHMAGNKSFLTDYQEIDGGFVAFGGSPKGGKTSGKGKIRTGKLDSEDVYFVKELKFNLFYVSQMCDKKNSVLFTETECLVLSPDFKLPDENQVLLKVPRQNNMYSFNLKNVVPLGGIKQFWTSAKIKIVNDDVQIQALVDGKKVFVNEASIKRDLRLDDAEGTVCLPNDALFEELARMSAKTTAWNEFSSTMAFAIIYLANNHKFNFSKYILDNMVKNLEAGVKFYMFPRFVQVFVNHQLGDMSHHKGIFVNPSLTKKRKHKPRRKQREATEIPHTEPQAEERVLDLEKAKTDQAKEIADLKKRVKKLERKKKSRTLGLKRLYKIGLSAKIVSSDEEGLGDQDDASKHRKSIADINQDKGTTLVDDTQGRINDQDLFRLHNLDGDKVFIDVTTSENLEHDVTVAKKEVTTIEDIKVTFAAATTPQISKDELTLAQTLMEIKAAKPKEKGVIIQEPSKFRTTSPSQPPQAKNKGKGIMIELGKNLKKKDQITLDEEVARKLKVKMKVEMDKLQLMLIEVTEASSKRAKEELEKESAKKQKLDEQEQLKRCLEIVPEDDDDVAIEATPLSSKSPTIVDYKIYKEGKKRYFKIIKADGNSQNYLTFRKMFKNFNREDLEVLRSIVKERFKKTKPVNDMDNLLFQTLKTMFEHHVKDIIWKYQQRAVKVYNWKLFDSCEVYYVTTKNIVYYLLVEKMYPFTTNILHQLWKDVRFHVDYGVEMAYDLFRLIKRQINEGYKLE
uniref:Ribonuclease H-like domain-containing protein n=1 Tax=Tanacetum cinerariifolium TaxID=118510 RepID=A0A699GQP7_TANCI|nr:ribonuclease H-like domain-containing protein [Tanacetum cinerariifolium]